MDLTELYRDVIREHSKSPRNHRVIEPNDGTADGHNPLCGDRVTLYVTRDGDTVVDVAFIGQACAMCTASASMLTQRLKGKTVAEVQALADAFVHAVVDPAEPDWLSAELEPIEDLAALSGVRKFPMRVKCVTLPWHTMKAALAGEPVAQTE